MGTLRTLMGGVSEGAIWPEFTVRGVHGGGATLKSLGDVRRLVLPAAIKDAMQGKPKLVDAVNGAVLEPLLDKDAGFLRALEVLFGGEGAPEDAAAMRGLMNRRCGLEDAEDKEDVRSRMVALLEARGDKLPLGLVADLGLMFRYLAGSPEQRRDLLAGGLFVRCAAALLCGSYTGFLEVDAGAAGGCEVNSITRSLLINIGQTEMNLAGVAPAQQQLANVGKVATFTLDRALAAARSAARAPRQVQELPVRLCVQGCRPVCRAGNAYAAAGRGGGQARGAERSDPEQGTGRASERHAGAERGQRPRVFVLMAATRPQWRRLCRGACGGSEARGDGRGGIEYSFVKLPVYVRVDVPDNCL